MTADMVNCPHFRMESQKPSPWKWGGAIALVILVPFGAMVATKWTARVAPAPIDKVFTFKGTSAHARNPLTMTMRVTAATFNTPFTWSVNVTDATGASLYQVEHHDDKNLDETLGAEGTISGCKGYEACKKKWYFTDLTKDVAEAVETVDNSKDPLDQGQRGVLIDLADEFLKDRGLSEEKRKAVLEEMLGLLATRYDRLYIPEDPFAGSTSFMYVPSLGYFVPCWHS
jgi:hypothetical protein